MLIEFKVTNYRSFREKQTLSMVAERVKEHQQTNSFDPKVPGFGRLLRSAVIYGPNASGKTNLLRALQVLQNLVVSSAGNIPGQSYPLVPFKFAGATRASPTTFEVTFAQNGVRYEYGLCVDSERVHSEWLVEYAHARGRTMFERKFLKRSNSYEWRFSSFLKGQRALWSESTRPNALFLSTAVQLNSTQLIPIFEWFQKRLVVIVGIATMNPVLTLQLLETPDGKERLLPFLREADLGIAGLEVRKEPIPPGAAVVNSPHIIAQLPGETIPSLVTVTFSHRSEDLGENVSLDFLEESSGTQVLFRSAGAWLNVFANGEVLLFDEVDTSLHPLLTRFLIRRFHSDTVNPNNSQLIFTTHNTIHLSKDEFRRDQIWFTEKDLDGASKLYPLSDFHPRNKESLERGYILGRYGAVPILDGGFD